MAVDENTLRVRNAIGGIVTPSHLLVRNGAGTAQVQQLWRRNPANGQPQLIYMNNWLYDGFMPLIDDDRIDIVGRGTRVEIQFNRRFINQVGLLFEDSAIMSNYYSSEFYFKLLPPKGLHIGSYNGQSLLTLINPDGTAANSNEYLANKFTICRWDSQRLVFELAFYYEDDIWFYYDIPERIINGKTIKASECMAIKTQLEPWFSKPQP